MSNRIEHHRPNPEDTPSSPIGISITRAQCERLGVPWSTIADLTPDEMEQVRQACQASMDDSLRKIRQGEPLGVETEDNGDTLVVRRPSYITDDGVWRRIVGEMSYRWLCEITGAVYLDFDQPIPFELVQR